MGKPWAKYEVGFINHTKFLRLTGPAICLWVQGKNYADATMTDGLLPDAVVRQFRFFSEKSLTLLTGSAGHKTETELYAPLWEVHAVGWKMHDYLDYNDSRDVVMDRLAQIAESKRVDRERLQRWRASKQAKRTGWPRGCETPDETPDETPVKRRGNGDETVDETPLKRRGNGHGNADETPLKRSMTETVTASVSDLSLEQRASPAIVEDAIATRGARALERYQVLYAKHRHGAHYRPRPNLDWLDACDLCRHWDDARLDKLAVLVLTTDDEWIAKTDRSFKIFAMKASAMDARLAAWEAEQVTLREGRS